MKGLVIKKICFVIMGSLLVLSASACTSEGKTSATNTPTKEKQVVEASKDENEGGKMQIDVNGKSVVFTQCQFKTESMNGNFVATQIHSTDFDTVFALGWYKVDSVDKITAGEYKIDVKTIYGLLTEKDPDLEVYTAKEGTIKIDSNDGLWIKGSVECKCANTKNIEKNIKGTFTVPVKK